MTEAHRTIEQGVLNWLRVLWLRAFYWPAWDVIYRVRRAWQVQKQDHYIVTFEELVRVTEGLDEHPAEWDFPCHCAECRSYADG
jgi:hypothetical protein